MAEITLLLALHNHQPVGNFDHVFRQGHDRCYRPLLETIADAPAVKLSLHHTGPLLEWLVSHEPGTIDLLRTVVERGQVEILGGGFYEPMLAVLPERDAIGQIKKMARWCEQNLGVTPRGMWLAERVWEPDLARVLHRGGIEYTLLDDTHFRYAGFQQEHLTGHYITEKAGESVKIFPISKHLRYAIPFHPVEEVIALMRTVADTLETASGPEPTRIALTYGDDGEKFGMWPHTYEWVFEKKWLARFFAALTDNSDWLATAQLGEHVDAHWPEGRVYLPTASYEEMMGWALPTEAIVPYEDFRHDLEAKGELEDVRPFVRGGMWQGFLAKYPESNAVHKKMLRVSAKVEQARQQRISDDVLESAEDHLYRAQCNCAYWHGLFGGIYLNWLRSALREHLIQAETELIREQKGPRFVDVEFEDVDLDGRTEVIVSTANLGSVISPHRGGSAMEIDLRDFGYSPTDVVARRPEGYHRQLADAVVPGEDEGVEALASIHDRVTAKEAGLERFLVEDRVPRFSFLDDILQDGDPSAMLRGLFDQTVPRVVPLSDAEYELVETIETPEAIAVSLRCQATAEAADLMVDKRYEIPVDRCAIRCRSTVRCSKGSVGDARFATGFNLTLLASDAPDRRLQIGDEPATSMGATVVGTGTQITMTDGWRRLAIELASPVPFLALIYPVETVTQSEDGFERTYQGTCLTLTWPISMEAGDEAHFDVELSFTHFDG